MSGRTIDLTDERIERFWRRVDRRSPEECWEWTGERHTRGYGLYSEWGGNRRTLRFYAHRMSALIAGLDIAGLVVRHHCDNPPCVNPHHLTTGTQADNVRDALERGRMNMSGLAAGHALVRPPRPCRGCGVTVREGRRRYCEPCRVAANADSQARYNAKVRAS